MKFKTNLTILLLVLSFVVVAKNASAQVSVDANGTVNTPVVDAKARLNATIEQNKEMRKEIRDEKKGEIRDLRASSSMMFKKLQGERKDMVKTLKHNEFTVRKDALVKQLNMSLSNLTSIRTRINERIIKAESEGRVLTEAKASLVVADDKLAKAKVAVDALAAYTVTTNSAAAASSTTEVELSKPRLVGDTAIKAVKDARDALKEVVRLIAKNMGVGATASSTKSI